MTDDEMVIRKSQAVSPFGVGSLFEVLGQSYVACDTTFWGSDGKRIDLPRLAKLLGVDHFRLPPSNPDFTPASLKEYMPFMRFPLWQLCASCRRISKLRTSDSDKTPTCQFCKGNPRLAPIRYVNICKNGHLGDINWHKLVHSTNKATPSHRQCQAYDSLYWRAGGRSGTKRGEYIVCEACAASFEVLDLIQRPMACKGTQPWEKKQEACSELARARPRGATNLHFPFIESGLDISDRTQSVAVTSDEASKVKSHKDFKVVSTMTANSPAFKPKVSQISNETLVERRKVELIIEQEKAHSHATEAPEDQVIRLEIGEWQLFHDNNLLEQLNTQLCAKPVHLNEWADASQCGRLLTDLIGKVIVVDKVREVRALKGFARVEPDLDKLIKPSLDISANWLPAIEVYGEGIFFTLNSAKLKSWEQNKAVMQRCEEFIGRSTSSFWGKLLPHPTPRLLLLHTLAHLVIRGLSFSCGYSSSALRERIYSSTADEDENMAGIFIYTSSGDSEGSLGGLARQGEPSRFLRTLITGLRSAEWCSSDPVCGEVWSGPGSLNHAACHVCSLLPETSCQFHNMFLDRTLIIDSGSMGFFNSVRDFIYEQGKIK